MSENKKSPLPQEDSNDYTHRNQGITLFFGGTKIHLDPLEILFFLLLGLPIGIMIRDSPNATFEDAMKQVLAVITTTTGIRTLPTDKVYQYLVKVSFDSKKKEDE